MSFKKPENEILECSHCGNKTPHGKVFEYVHPMLFDEMDDQRYTEDYRWLVFSCSTCGGLNLYGDFLKYPTTRDLARSKLYPKGCDLLPPARVLNPGDPVPADIVELYEQIWPLRQRSPAAFIGQIKRLLMDICDEQQIAGDGFSERMMTLLSPERTPGACHENLNRIVTLLNELGETRPDARLNVWDVQIVDDFFRAVLELVYLVPARIKSIAEKTRALYR